MGVINLLRVMGRDNVSFRRCNNRRAGKPLLRLSHIRLCVRTFPPFTNYLKAHLSQTHRRFDCAMRLVFFGHGITNICTLVHEAN